MSRSLSGSSRISTFGLVQEDQHQLQTALLSAGQVSYDCVQLRGLEPEPLQELGRGQLLAVDFVACLAPGKDLAHAAAAELVQLVELLREDGEPHALADLHLTRRGLERASDEVEERRLARAVLAQDAEPVTGADQPRDVVDDGPVAIPLGHAEKVDDLLTGPERPSASARGSCAWAVHRR